MYAYAMIDYRESMFAFTTQSVVIEVPESTSDCPEPKTFKQFSHKKKTIPMMRGRDKKLTWHKGIWRYHGESLRGSLRWERFVS